MQSLREVVAEFQASKRAVGHFNVSDSNQLEAVAEAAKETGLPVIVGLSEGERKFFPLAHARSLIDQYIKEGVQLYLNADHTYSAEKAKEAIDAGADSVVVDGAQLPFAENVSLVKQIVEYAMLARRSPGEAEVEGELGYIGASSKQLDELPEGVTEANLTTAQDAKKFVEETGVHMFAPAVGNVHGMLKNAKEPRLHPERVKEIARAVGVPLVLHGASGNTDDDIRACIKAGIAVAHINTELRLAYHDSLEKSLASEETTPYKFLAPAVADMKAFVMRKVKLFAE